MIRSSFCSMGNCVEVTTTSWGAVVVRDSANANEQDNPGLVFSPDEWDEFVKGVKAGEFDLARLRENTT